MGVPATVRECLIQSLKDIPHATSMQQVGDILSQFTIILGVIREHAKMVVITPNMAKMALLPPGAALVYLTVEDPPSDSVIYDLFLTKLSTHPAQLIQVSMALHVFKDIPAWADVNELLRDVLVRHTPMPRSGSMGSALVASVREDATEERTPKHQRVDPDYDYSTLDRDYPTQELSYDNQQELLQYNVNMAALDLANSSAALLASTRGGQSVYDPTLSGSSSPSTAISTAQVPHGVCRGFYLTGSCNFGSSCRFQHSRPSTGSSTAGAGPARSGGGRGGPILPSGGGPSGGRGSSNLARGGGRN
jgi:uncharacterized membrane protein YgcG